MSFSFNTPLPLLCVLLIGLIDGLNGEAFLCLDQCTCDTHERLIDCSRQGMDKMPNLTGRPPLHGFTVLNLRENCLDRVQYNEAQIRRALPDVDHIDLHYNPISCDQIGVTDQQFEAIELIHNCGRANTRVMQTKCQAARNARKSRCGGLNDFECHLQIGWEELKKLAKEVWSKTENFWNEHKHKVGDPAKAVGRQVETWFNDVVEFGKDVVNKI